MQMAEGSGERVLGKTPAGLPHQSRDPLEYVACSLGFCGSLFSSIKAAAAGLLGNRLIEAADIAASQATQRHGAVSGAPRKRWFSHLLLFRGEVFSPDSRQMD
jgi:hypothetical protein